MRRNSKIMWILYFLRFATSSPAVRCGIVHADVQCPLCTRVCPSLQTSAVRKTTGLYWTMRFPAIVVRFTFSVPLPVPEVGRERGVNIPPLCGAFVQRAVWIRSAPRVIAGPVFDVRFNDRSRFRTPAWEHSVVCRSDGRRQFLPVLFSHCDVEPLF